MFIKQTDLFREMDKDFVKKIMDISQKEIHEDNEWLFHEGDTATRFYILLKGCIKLRTGEGERAVYVVNHPGEAFGWSSLIGRESYTASAQCKGPVKIICFNSEDIMKIIDADPPNGLIFFKHLVSLLGNRLLQSYAKVSAVSSMDVYTSYGAGRLQENVPLN